METYTTEEIVAAVREQRVAIRMIEAARAIPRDSAFDRLPYAVRETIKAVAGASRKPAMLRQVNADLLAHLRHVEEISPH
jgi:hypothetical protein